MLQGNLKKGISQKTGKEYMMIEIELAPDYKKIVFLDSAEVALVKATQKN